MTRIIFVVLAVVASTAHAQPAEPKPWAVGVGDDEQKLALELYDQGNAEFQAARFAQAVAKYKDALKHWDHPAIHFNLAVCFINLDNPLDAKAHLDRALAYGEDPLGADLYAQGITYKHSIDGQISHLKITCREPGTTITLDGTYLFTAPGETEKFVLPGKHQIVGTKPGFLTASETLDLVPARVTEHDVHLVALKAATKLVRKWPSWQPWTVLGGGGGALVLGGLSLWFAKHEFANYDSGVAARCPGGCTAELAASLSDLRSVRHHGDIAQDIAFSLFTVGGAAAIAGAIGVVLNQPRAVTERSLPTITPTAGGASVTLGWTF